MPETICGYCRRPVEEHAVPDWSPGLFDSCRVVLAQQPMGGTVFRLADGVICTLRLPG